MLISTSEKTVNLVERPGRILLAVDVRSWELTGEYPWAADPLHGVEGVWYLPDEDGDFVFVEPCDKSEQYRWLYDLTPVPSQETKLHCIHRHRHRWLVRYWDRDVYMPTTASMRIEIIEYFQGDGPPIWKIVGNNYSICGISIDHKTRGIDETSHYRSEG